MKKRRKSESTWFISLYVVYCVLSQFFLVVVRLISIDETFESLPSSLVTLSVPIVMFVIFAFFINLFRTISAVSTAVLIALPLAFKMTSFEPLPLNWVMTAMT